MDPAVVFYEAGMSLRVIADELRLNSIKFGSCLLRPVCMHRMWQIRSVLEPSGSGGTER